MNVLFLTQRLPYAPNRGDRIRAYYLMAEMSGYADVSLFSFVHDDDEQQHAASVPFAVDVAISRVPRWRNAVRSVLSLPTDRPLTHTMLDAPDAHRQIARLVASRRPDLVFAYCTGMARFVFEPPLDQFPAIVDVVDVDSQKWRRLSRQSHGPRSWIFAREARALATFEHRAALHAGASLVVNDRERDALAAIAPMAPIHVIPNGIDVAAWTPPVAPSEVPTVVFCGVMDYPPNTDAVLWFGREIWPLIRAARPDARFVVVGSTPTRAIMRLSESDPSIAITGQVERVQPYLWDAAVSVAPIRVAQGVQNKVLEALAAGLPVVVTQAVAAGLPEHVTRGCRTAAEPAAFAAAVLSLLDDTPAARRRLAAAACVERLGWPAQLAPLRAVLARAADGTNQTRHG